MAAYAWGVEVAKLDSDALNALITSAIVARLHERERRSLLLARIPQAVQANLQDFSRSGDQLRGDVVRLNELELLDAWISAARQLSPGFETGPASPPPTAANVAALSNTSVHSSSAGAVATEDWSVLVVDSANTRLRGSGVIVGSRHILTAKHVVTGSDRCGVRLTTAGVAHPATVTWRSADLDVALLLTEKPIDLGASIGKRTRVGFIQGDVNWRAYGYPALYAKTPSEELQQEGGRTHFWSVGSTLPLALRTVDGPKGEGALNGLSGAGVLVDDRVVAIITMFEKARRQDRINAVPLARFFTDPGFRAAAGLPTGPASDERWQELRASMLRVLGISIIRKAFVAQLGVALNDPEAVLNELLQRPAAEVVRWLNVVITDLSRRAPQHAADLRALMLALVPWLTDLRALRESQHEALHSGECCFDLPCRNGLFIEALMAGMNPRAMASPDALLAGDGGPQLKLSSISYAPVADADGSAAVDGVVREIAWHEGIDEEGKTRPQLLDAVLKHLTRLLEDPDDPLDASNLVEEVEDLLQYATERPEDAFHYYLFFDAQDGETVLAENRQALRDALPSLWLVRSTTRHEAERKMVKHLKNAAVELQKAMPSDD